ncbi:hypothetical protein C5167_050394 [Papaver somniferum]|uniref:Uncharacterized protein n=1 Tax=Papaver somniferum TaxID=3469 RepID=A0A4Y7KNJ4_PAPSO|nr:hypothetical protein C5167_050394 [Papaver somniferum]
MADYGDTTEKEEEEEESSLLVRQSNKASVQARHVGITREIHPSQQIQGKLLHEAQKINREIPAKLLRIQEAAAKRVRAVA